MGRCRRFLLQLQTCASIWSPLWRKTIKWAPTFVNCGSCLIKTAWLKRHEMVHAGERCFRCNICGKYFFSASVIRQKFSIGSSCCFHYKSSYHIVHMGLSLLWSYHLSLSPLWKSLRTFKTVVLFNCFS